MLPRPRILEEAVLQSAGIATDSVFVLSIYARELAQIRRKKGGAIR